MKRKKLSPVSREKSRRRRSNAAAMKEVTRLGQGFVLFQELSSPNAKPKSSETAAVLGKKIGRALAKPGVDRSVIFPPDQPGLFAYSIDPRDPKRIVRKSADGKRTFGRFVGGRFKAL